jgi:hypothetical protein
MVSNKRELISYHERGTRAANAGVQFAIAEILSKPLPAAIEAANKFSNPTLMQAVIIHAGCDENLDQAMQMIYGDVYFQTHLHLQDLQEIEREKSARISELWLDEFPIYPSSIKDLHPTPIISMVEVLTESSMPSHAPTAAATSELQSVTY